MIFRKGKRKKIHQSGNIRDPKKIEYHEMKRYFYIRKPSWKSAFIKEMRSCDSVSLGRGKNTGFQLQVNILIFIMLF